MLLNSTSFHVAIDQFNEVLEVKKKRVFKPNPLPTKANKTTKPSNQDTDLLNFFLER
jgi:hypothetical protein